MVAEVFNNAPHHIEVRIDLEHDGESDVCGRNRLPFLDEPLAANLFDVDDLSLILRVER